MATAAQMSANSTAWSLKKLPTISVPTPSQGQRRVSPARAGFYHMGLLRRVGVGQLEIGRDLLEITNQLVADAALEHRQQRPQRLDRQACLIEIPLLIREPPVAQRRHGVERLDEEIRDLQFLQLLLELPHELLVGRRLLLSHRRAPAAAAPAPRTRPGGSRAARASRTDARRRSPRGLRGTEPRRSPPRPAAPTRSATRSVPGPERPRRARSRSARPSARTGSLATGSLRGAGSAGRAAPRLRPAHARSGRRARA